MLNKELLIKSSVPVIQTRWEMLASTVPDPEYKFAAIGYMADIQKGEPLSFWHVSPGIPVWDLPGGESAFLAQLLFSRVDGWSFISFGKLTSLTRSPFESILVNGVVFDDFRKHQNKFRGAAYGNPVGISNNQRMTIEFSIPPTRYLEAKIAYP